MVSVGKNFSHFNENPLVKSEKLAGNAIDDIFAELFSLVDLSSLNQEKNNLETKENLSINNNSNELDAAKSLISIFYKEINLNSDQTTDLEDLKQEIDPEDQDKNHFLQAKVSEESIPNILNKDEIKKEFVNKEFINQNATEVNSKKKNKDKKNFFSRLNANVNKLDFFDNNQKNTEKAQSFDPNQMERKINQDSNVISQKLVKKKEEKKNNFVEKIKLNVTYNDKKSEPTLTKHSLISEHKIVNRSNNKISELNTAFNRFDSNDNKIKNFEKNTFSSSSFENQETLDMLESSWGEKLIKTIKDNLERGHKKIDISLEPKNLGKLKVEVELIGDKTDIKINSDNKFAALMLNDNQHKLTEMLEKESIKLGYFSSNQDQKNNSNNKENNKNRNEEVSFTSNQKSTDSSKKVSSRKSIHNVDINA